MQSSQPCWLCSSSADSPTTPPHPLSGHQARHTQYTLEASRGSGLSYPLPHPEKSREAFDKAFLMSLEVRETNMS